MSTEPLLSERGNELLLHEDFLTDYLTAASKNPFHPIDNEQGVINMGTAVNRLMEEELQERLNKGDALKFTSNIQHYYDFSGSEDLRNALSAFLNRHFNPSDEIIPEKLVVMNGVTSCLDVLGHTICDPGDVIISPTPVYGRIFTDFTDRSRVVVKPLPLTDEYDENGKSFQLTSQALEEKIKELKYAGDNVRGFILLNPNNPLGDVYKPDLVLEIADVCARHNVHLIIDEIYALSVIDPEVDFVSSLSLKFPDPERVHFVWGFSKDFGLAGFRAGVIYTHNIKFVNSLKVVGIYQATSSLVHQALVALINDIDWCDKFFIPTNKSKLQTTYNKACIILESEGIKIRKAPAALFLWVHIAPYLTDQTEQAEMELFEEVFKAGLYIVPATKLFTKPGWFRIVYSVSNEEVEIGLGRLIRVLKARSN